MDGYCDGGLIETPAIHDIETNADDDWANRTSYWSNLATAKPSSQSRKKERLSSLILCGHGISLRIDGGSLFIRNGFTHYPQKREEYRFYSGDWRLPSRIVMLGGSGSLSFDVLDWLSARNIPLIRIDWQGKTSIAIGGMPSGIERRNLEAQLRARDNGNWLPFARYIIAQKFIISAETLKQIAIGNDLCTEALRVMELVSLELERNPPQTAAAIVGIEGRVAAAYFSAWRSIPLNWKGTTRHPIPDNWRAIGVRSSFAGISPKSLNRNATHPFNAMLNYAYAVLESQVRIAIMAVGFDPTIGYLHGRYRDKHALVLDLMEPLRPIVDRAVLRFIMKEQFAPSDFTLRHDGVVRVNPQLARELVRIAISMENYKPVIEKALNFIIRNA